MAAVRGLLIGVAVVAALFIGIPLLYVYGPLLMLVGLLLLPGLIAIASIAAAVLEPADRVALVAFAVVMAAISIWLLGSFITAWQ